MDRPAFPMKRVKCVVCVFLLWSVYIPLPAVENLRLPDIRAVGMGMNGVTESVWYNPSLIALSTHKSVYIQYFNLYGLKELNTIGGGVQYPNAFLPLAVNISSFGYDEYRENRVRISVGKRLNEQWSLGISIQYNWLQTVLTEKAVSVVAADLGIGYRLVENVFIGMLIKDLPSVKIRHSSFDYKDNKDFLAQIGFQWHVVNSLLIVGSAGGSDERKIFGSAGIEYTAWKAFHLRAGIQTDPLLPSFGIGYVFRRFSLDIAGIYHRVLGVHTGIGLSYSF